MHPYHQYTPLPVHVAGSGEHYYRGAPGQSYPLNEALDSEREREAKEANDQQAAQTPHKRSAFWSKFSVEVQLVLLGVLATISCIGRADFNAPLAAIAYTQISVNSDEEEERERRQQREEEEGQVHKTSQYFLWVFIASIIVGDLPFLCYWGYYNLSEQHTLQGQGVDAGTSAVIHWICLGLGVAEVILKILICIVYPVVQADAMKLAQQGYESYNAAIQRMQEYVMNDKDKGRSKDEKPDTERKSQQQNVRPKSSSASQVKSPPRSPRGKGTQQNQAAPFSATYDHTDASRARSVGRQGIRPGSATVENAYPQYRAVY
uniref:Uncharacterized protein n=1 Tax=Chromera velia CCMP2878 TaxID=1169474 RepID=A0A0G4FRZ0_9ALVE|eukprot:Cvel_3672.t1-p1 / transcript=Cvel_3672.t1 / gene=Cvel_3672 / organism=Chromera_velia_CCMP2878 / gene_product=hypothetical protein / transcript_product=hypothetical protein / location=Cvel_scaffold152:104771-105724(-) / protein_length=318 / sequence_SO=supercontig / SO=protein_coding / is_pseudo=false